MKLQNKNSLGLILGILMTILLNAFGYWAIFTDFSNLENLSFAPFWITLIYLHEILGIFAVFFSFFMFYKISRFWFTSKLNNTQKEK